MQRIVEPELMDDDGQARAYSEANFGGPHSAFVELLRAKSALPQTARVVDLGCGPADVLVRTAVALPNWSLVGADGSAAMLGYGHKRLRTHQLESRVTLVQAMFPGADLGGPFDGVISNSLLHHLHDPMVLWREVSAQAAPGAFVFVMDLMRPADEATVDDFVTRYAEGEPEVLREDFYHSLRAAFTVDEVRAQLDAAGLSELRVESVSDRHLIVYGTLPA